MKAILALLGTIIAAPFVWFGAWILIGIVGTAAIMSFALVFALIMKIAGA